MPRAVRSTAQSGLRRRTQHGFSDQEAPQAHVQEEAPQAAAQDPRPASQVEEVGRSAPPGNNDPPGIGGLPLGIGGHPGDGSPPALTARQVMARAMAATAPP